MLKIIRTFFRVFFSLFVYFTAARCKKFPVVWGWTRVNRSTFIGENCNFNGLIIYGSGEVLIGDNFHSGYGCKILTEVHNYNGNAIPYDSTYITKKIIIEDNVWFGMNVTVLASCTIGEGAILQACSVIVSDIPKFSIAGGNPARVFKYRNIENYQILKSEKKFL